MMMILQQSTCTTFDAVVTCNLIFMAWGTLPNERGLCGQPQVTSTALAVCHYSKHNLEVSRSQNGTPDRQFLLFLLVFINTWQLIPVQCCKRAVERPNVVSQSLKKSEISAYISQTGKTMGCRYYFVV
jgi:hypothetical protein